MSFIRIKKRRVAEKKLVFVTEKPILLNMDVDYKKQEVWVKTNEDEFVGFAKVNPVATDNKVKVCTLTHFETSLQKMGIGRMMLLGILSIAKNNEAMKIDVFPDPVDLQIKGIKVLSVDELCEIYQRLGFAFYKENPDMLSVTDRKMFINIDSYR